MKKYALFIGIDISKKWIDVSLTTDGNKTTMDHKQFANTIKGFKQMLEWLKPIAKELEIATHEWLFCMEHTGVYTIPLSYFLEEQALDYILEVALRIQRSLGLKRGKDDKADSKDIARYAYLLRAELKPKKLPSEALLELQTLISFRARLVKQMNALRTPAQEMKQFMPKERCQNIVQDSQDIVLLIKSKIGKVEQRMKQIIEQHLELKQVFDLATSVKGIGKICAIQMLIHTNGFQGFENHKKFACYIGIAPFAHRSGSSLNVPARVSHLGQKRLKALFTNAAVCAIQHDKELKIYYERKLAQGKNKFSVINAVKNKLISRVFATVKRGTPFVELNRYA